MPAKSGSTDLLYWGQPPGSLERRVTPTVGKYPIEEVLNNKIPSNDQSRKKQQHYLIAVVGGPLNIGKTSGQTTLLTK
jgi:hypothetical protein